MVVCYDNVVIKPLDFDGEFTEMTFLETILIDGLQNRKQEVFLLPTRKLRILNRMVYARDLR